MKHVVTTLFGLSLFSFAMLAAAQHADTPALETDQGPVDIHPVHHASFVMTWHGQTVYVDPTGDAEQYADLGQPDLILLTHPHGDHLDPDTLDALETGQATVVMPQSVADEIGDDYGKTQRIMANGDSLKTHDLRIQAVPMYNLPESDDAYHPKGWGNGYVLTLGGKRVYISGDTEGTPEMRGLENIDLAFVCMNLPYTMNVEQAADAVADFKPKIVYPYHYRGQDVKKFKRLVNDKTDAVDVRLRNWYPE